MSEREALAAALKSYTTEELIAELVRRGDLRYESEDRGGALENWMQRPVGAWVKEVLNDGP